MNLVIIFENKSYLTLALMVVLSIFLLQMCIHCSCRDEEDFTPGDENGEGWLSKGGKSKYFKVECFTCFNLIDKLFFFLLEVVKSSFLQVVKLKFEILFDSLHWSENSCFC